MNNNDKPFKLSPHFTSTEFACSHCGVFQIDMRLVNALEELRVKIGKPIAINSAFRCAEHNKAVGGAQSSEHTKGLAADLAIPKNVTISMFYAAIDSIEAFKTGGVGIYPQKKFIHVDVRGKRARWAQVDDKYVGIEVGLTYGKQRGNT